MGVFGYSLLCVVLATCINGSPAPTSTVYDTIVVGMGASGTAAAATLAKHGKNVLVLEAQNRMGGRVYSVYFGDDYVEVGAEWIHGIVHSPTYELAVKNNVTILEQTGDNKVYRSDGSSDKEELILELNEFSAKAYDNLPNEAMPLGQYMTNKIKEYLKDKHPEVLEDSDFLNNYLEYMEVFIGTNDAYYSWNDVTTKGTDENLEGSYAMSWHKYSYWTLFEILLNRYNKGPGHPNLKWRLNTEVVKIEQPQDPKNPVTVTTADGTKYFAKNVIVTVSIAVLKQKHSTLFSPALPEEKVKAIEAIQMGESAKIMLRFDDIWWPNKTLCAFVWRDADKASVSEEDKWITKINAVGSPMSNEKVLTLWATGNAALKVESLSDEIVQEKVMWLLRKFMGAGITIPEPVAILKSSWHSNPFVQGVYSYDDLNIPNHPTVRAELSNPLKDSSGAPRVLFAGEATNTKHYATVHGAVEAGYREANRLLLQGIKNL